MIWGRGLTTELHKISVRVGKGPSKSRGGGLDGKDWGKKGSPQNPVGFYELMCD